MKLIHIYLLRCMAPYLISALAVFSLVVFMQQFIRVFNTAVMLGISAVWVLDSMVNLMPTVIGLSLPMAFQVAMLLTLGAVSERGELIALRSAGFSINQIAVPFFCTALVICSFLFYVNNWLSPYGFERFQNSRHMVTTHISKINLEPKTFVSVGEWSLQADEVNKETGDLKTVHLFRYFTKNDDKETFRISAPNGNYKVEKGKGISLTLFGGEFQRLTSKTVRKLDFAKFGQYSIFIPFNVSLQERGNPSLTEMSSPAIIKAVLNNSSLPPKRIAEYKIEVSTRVSNAFAPVVFFLLSCSFGFMLTKRNKAGGIVISILVLFVYYGLLTLGISIGRRFLFTAWYAPLLADFLGLIGGLVLWKFKLKG